MALAVVPALCAAALAAVAVGVVAHNSVGPSPLHGSATTILAILGALLALVVVGAVMAAGSVARTVSAEPETRVEYVRVEVPAAPQPQAQQQAYQQSQQQQATPPSYEQSQAAPAAARPESQRTEVQQRGEGGESEDVFVHLSRRLQSLVHRQIELLDGLENEVEDPDLLKGLFDVDHLATRMRRHAENLAVLGGARPRRQWTRPVSVMEVLRSAVSETLDYARVQVIPRAPGSLNGYAVADVIHLLAELVENATAFSPPGTKVVLRAHVVTAGLAIEVDDHGLGMHPLECDRLNALLRDPAGVNVQELLQGARIGLYVVAQLARRHGIAIQLQPNITGGIQALVVLPRSVLAVPEQALPEYAQEQRPQAIAAAVPAPSPVQAAPAQHALPPVYATMSQPVQAAPVLTPVYASAPPPVMPPVRVPAQAQASAHSGGGGNGGIANAVAQGTELARRTVIQEADEAFRRPAVTMPPQSTAQRSAPPQPMQQQAVPQQPVPQQAVQQQPVPQQPTPYQPTSHRSAAQPEPAQHQYARPQHAQALQSFPPVPAPPSQSPSVLPPSSARDPQDSLETDLRPPLPRRQPQENLAAELSGAPGTSTASGASPSSDSAGLGPSPSFMADFRRGLFEGTHVQNQENTR